jgi:hypothetical protein
MKKIFVAFLAVVLLVAFGAPAMAANLKLTSKGYMDVTGIWISNGLFDVFPGPRTGNQDDSADWYQQELIINPVLHINEKVRIHGRFTIMERMWRGIHGGEFDGESAGMGVETNYRSGHNFWVEQIYLSFPLFGGTLYVGRMPGGGWAYPFQNWDRNRDRIKYVRKFGPVLLIGVIEKLLEADAPVVQAIGDQIVGIQNDLTWSGVVGGPYDTAHNDLNAYAVGAVVPLSKSPLIVWRPLFYYIDRQNTNGYTAIIMNAFMVKAGIFRMDAEVNFRWRCDRNAFINDGNWRDWNARQWSAWFEAGVHPGPFSIVLGGMFLEGTSQVEPWNSRSLWGVGAEFQPSLLLFSEDMGVLWNTAGVANGTGGASGYQMLYLRANYKINDTMNLYGIVGCLWAHTMWDDTADGVNHAGKFLGTEANLGFKWNFIDNISYVFEAAYLWPGDYWNSFAGWNTNRNVFGFRHMLVIEW